ncbi:MAG: aspartate/glutamate racemase family protein [Alphaproteobacteria bacterium]|nr:aspartate/glutamate racemase family protein [Alphaproteobacteria bacterium]
MGGMRILVINPNSNQAVTDGMADALKPLQINGGPEIECVTLAEGPFGIESQADVESVTLPLKKLVSESNDADAFVIACYSDPGLHVCREATDKPVFGIQECGVLTALSQGGQFGVIALSSTSIKRHLRYIRQMGVMERLAKERAVDLSVEESASGQGTFDRLCEVGRELRDLDGAETIILGCAGMAIHRAALADHLGIPVTDPVQAATSMAIGTVLLRCH